MTAHRTVVSTTHDFPANLAKRELLTVRLFRVCNRMPLILKGTSIHIYKLGVEVLRRKFPLPSEVGATW